MWIARAFFLFFFFFFLHPILSTAQASEPCDPVTHPPCGTTPLAPSKQNTWRIQSLTLNRRVQTTGGPGDVNLRFRLYRSHYTGPDAGQSGGSIFHQTENHPSPPSTASEGSNGSNGSSSVAAGGWSESPVAVTCFDAQSTSASNPSQQCSADPNVADGEGTGADSGQHLRWRIYALQEYNAFGPDWPADIAAFKSARLQIINSIPLYNQTAATRTGTNKTGKTKVYVADVSLTPETLRCRQHTALTAPPNPGTVQQQASSAVWYACRLASCPRPGDSDRRGDCSLRVNVTDETWNTADFLIRYNITEDGMDSWFP